MLSMCAAGRSRGVVEMLEKLLDKFIEERTVLEKEEMNAESDHEAMMKDISTGGIVKGPCLLSYLCQACHCRWLFGACHAV